MQVHWATTHTNPHRGSCGSFIEVTEVTNPLSRDSGLVTSVTSIMGSVAFCRRCQLGIALGIVTAIASLAVSVIKMGITSNRKVLTRLFTTEMFLSGVLVVWQAIGVAFVTSQTGPGAPLNNLWYSSWGSLVLGIILVASCVDDWSAAKGALKEAGNASVRDGSSTVFGDEGESLARTQTVGAAGSVSRFSQAQTMGTAYVSQEQSQTSSLYLT